MICYQQIFIELYKIYMCKTCKNKKAFLFLLFSKIDFIYFTCFNYYSLIHSSRLIPDKSF